MIVFNLISKSMFIVIQFLYGKRELIPKNNYFDIRFEEGKRLP